jgi:hypothetical protein
MPPGAYPDEAEIDEIARLPDPVLRNLRVTQGYHELATALAAHTGPWTNWCAMATWASRQAGRTIRAEDLDDAVARLSADVFGSPVADALVRALRALGARADVAVVRAAIRRRLGLDDALRRSSEAVSRGNIKVFTEIGRDLSRFLRFVEANGPLDESAVVLFVETMPPGEPPEGKGLLRDAILHLHRSMFDHEADLAAQWQLLSNLEIGLHEQVRLQDEIGAALDAPVPDPDVLVDRLLADLFPRRHWIVRARRQLARLSGRSTPLDRAAAALVAEARSRLRRTLTDRIMTLDLAGQLVRLGADVRAPFPSSVERAGLAELVALLGRIDPTPDSLRESAAVDWADLGERMHFIADLFRAWHEAPQLLASPFTVEQVLEMRAGHVPEGRL